jgi:hypothetical protein
MYACYLCAKGSICNCVHDPSQSHEQRASIRIRDMIVRLQRHGLVIEVQCSCKFELLVFASFTFVLQYLCIANNGTDSPHYITEGVSYHGNVSF